MLVLSRRPHEAIQIGSHIRVVISGFHGSQVRVGIEAPVDITLDREEIYRRKQAESRAEAPRQPFVELQIYPPLSRAC